MIYTYITTDIKIKADLVIVFVEQQLRENECESDV